MKPTRGVRADKKTRAVVNARRRYGYGGDSGLLYMQRDGEGAVLV